MSILGIVPYQEAIQAAKAQGSPEGPAQVVDEASAKLEEVGYSDQNLLEQIIDALDKEATINWGILELARGAGNEALAQEAGAAMTRQLRLRRQLLAYLYTQRREGLDQGDHQARRL